MVLYSHWCTLLPPLNAPHYSGRKHGFNIICLIINDDTRRIRSYLAGWPGSVHDKRGLGKMEMSQSPKSHFSSSEYTSSDSALENCNFVVSALKKPPLKSLPCENERFNTKLAAARILAEHTIGLLKGWFPWLKQIRNCINGDRRSMRFILELIYSCVILHNLLIPEEKDLTDCERMDNEELSDVDDNSRAPRLSDRLYRPIRNGCRKDEHYRRLQTYLELMEYCQ